MVQPWPRTRRTPSTQEWIDGTHSGCGLLLHDVFRVEKRDELDHAKPEDGDTQLSEARRSGEVLKCLIIRCFESKDLFAPCILVKGADEEDFAAGFVATAVLWLGHLEVILKGTTSQPSRLWASGRSVS